MCALIMHENVVWDLLYKGGAKSDEEEGYLLVNMEHYKIQQRFLIVKHYNEMVKVATICKVCSVFGSNNIPNLSTVKRTFEKD